MPFTNPAVTLLEVSCAGANMSLKFLIGCIGLSLAATAFPASSQDFDEDDGPVEYVRVCDVYGAGFYYIPGTDTCLQISGSVRYEQVANNNSLGGGTVVRPGGERFVFGFSDYISRVGGGLNFEYGLGDYGGHLFGLGNAKTFLYGSLDYSAGDAKGSGSAEVGAGGVSGVGFTFLEPDGGTGVIANAAGFGIAGSGRIDNEWALGVVGAGFSMPLGEGDATEPKSVLVAKAGLFAEGIRSDAEGSSYLTFGGAPFAGYFQDWDYSSKDSYFGVKAELEYRWRPLDQLQLTFGGSLFPSYHDGEGSIAMDTGVGGGNVVSQSLDYDNDGFAIGAGVKFGIDWLVRPGFSIGAGVEYSVLPDVTTFVMPQNPSEQPGRYEEEDMDRWFITLLRADLRF